MTRLFPVILSSLLLSCSAKQVASKVSRGSNPVEKLFQEGSIKSVPIGDFETTVSELTFDNATEAKSYAMERRLLILRKFETLVEPYFGTVNAKSCQGNLKSSKLSKTDLSLSAVLQVPTNGENHVIHDCLIENNTSWAHIEFLTCGKRFYDIRVYFPITESPAYEQLFHCGVVE